MAQLLDDRTERHRGEEGEPAHDDDHPDQEPDEHGAVGAEGPEADTGTTFLAASAPARARPAR